jgi:hypothetical protein
MKVLERTFMPKKNENKLKNKSFERNEVERKGKRAPRHWLGCDSGN